MRLQGDSFRKIARTLNEEGVPSPRGFYYMAKGRPNLRGETHCWNDVTVKLVVSAYEDKVKGIMLVALCVQLMNRYEDERRGKLEQQTQLTTQLETTQEDEQATDEWLAVIRDHAQLKELDRPTLLRLVKRIEVGEKYEIAEETHRDIKIYYNFVEYVGL